MTPELNDCLSKRIAPFNGDCIANSQELSLEELQKILAVAIPLLQSTGEEPFYFADWFEHDGFTTHSRNYSWEKLLTVTKSKLELFESRDRDFGVRNAFHSANYFWLMRYNIDDDDESDYRTACCDFDLCIGANKQPKGIDIILDTSSKLEKCNAFDKFSSSR